MCRQQNTPVWASVAWNTRLQALSGCLQLLVCVEQLHQVGYHVPLLAPLLALPGLP